MTTLAPLTKKTIVRLRRDLRAEVGAAEIYLQQARKAKSPALRQGLCEIAQEERRHGEFLRQILRENGVHPGRCLTLQRWGGKMAGYTLTLFGLKAALRFNQRFERVNHRWYEEEAQYFASQGDGVKAIHFQSMAKGEAEHFQRLSQWRQQGLE